MRRWYRNLILKMIHQRIKCYLVRRVVKHTGELTISMYHIKEACLFFDYLKTDLQRRTMYNSIFCICVWTFLKFSKITLLKYIWWFTLGTAHISAANVTNVFHKIAIFQHILRTHTGGRPYEIQKMWSLSGIKQNFGKNTHMSQ